MKHQILAILIAGLASSAVNAQLAITENMSSASTNLGPALVTQGPDFWELTNFGTNSIDLSGYIFNDSDAIRGGDADTTTLSGITIGPGESIVLVQNGPLVLTRDDFINWWGATNLPVDIQVLFYTGNGQTATGDSLVLWAPDAASDLDFLDRADFGEALRGHTFTYNSSNGIYATISSNGIGNAFKAETSDDEGSPGHTTGPVPLLITQQPSPANQSVPAGQNATFSAAARGLPHPRYQWRFQGNPIAGAIQSTYTLTNAQLTDSGLYSVIVSNGLQTLISSNASLTVTTSPLSPTFSTAPKDADAFIGQTVRFTASVNGSPTPSLRWEKDGVPISGETSAQLTLFSVQTNDAAVYTIVAFSTAGTNSASATLMVGKKPQILITEIHSTGSSGHEDWWELTNFDDHSVNIKGWRWDDNSHSVAVNNAYIFTNDIVIHPGESVVFVENLSASVFQSWWGTNLPPRLQIVTYIGGGLGLSSANDEVNLWNGVTVVGNELTERIAAANFAALPAGITFIYDPENPPVAGIFSTLSTNTVNGAAANGIFAAASGGNIGSPGYVVAPVAGAANVAGNVSVSWNSIAGRNYAVYAKTNLADSWTAFTNITATATTTTVTDLTAPAQRFYRVSTVIPVVPEQP